jgi:hypothetical protein
MVFMGAKKQAIAPTSKLMRKNQAFANPLPGVTSPSSRSIVVAPSSYCLRIPPWVPCRPNQANIPLKVSGYFTHSDSLMPKIELTPRFMGYFSNGIDTA